MAIKDQINFYVIFEFDSSLMIEAFKENLVNTCIRRNVKKHKIKKYHIISYIP